MKIFKQEEVKRTLHSDEALAGGCSLQAAMILPQYHTSNFDVEECNIHPIEISWSISHPHEGHQTKSKLLFPLKNNFPTVKSMTFEHRHEPMELAIAYSADAEILPGIPTFLARYHIEIPKAKHEKFSLKLRVKLDQNQIPSLETAELIEEYKEEKKIPIKAAPAPQKEAKEGEAPAAAPQQEQAYETKMVDKTQSTNIHFKFEHHGFSSNQLTEFIKFENDMNTEDLHIVQLKEAKNSLETYIVDQRAYLDIYGDRAKYIEESAREKFLSELNEVGDWLYDEGAQSTKDIYLSKLAKLRETGDLIE